MNHLPKVRDLCVEQKMMATVSAGVKPELFLGTKKKCFTNTFIKSLFNIPQVKRSTHLHVNVPLTNPGDRSNSTPKCIEVSRFLYRESYLSV